MFARKKLNRVKELCVLIDSIIEMSVTINASRMQQEEGQRV